MEVIIFLFLVFVVVAAMQNVGQKKAALPPPPTPEQVRAVQAQTARALPAARPAKEVSWLDPSTWAEAATSSEEEVDETAGDHDLLPAVVADEEETAVVRADSERWTQGALARMPDAAAVSLEQEVDRVHEHERFHRRYVSAQAPPEAAKQGIMEELRNDPTALRRAILASEILGRPRSRRR